MIVQYGSSKQGKRICSAGVNVGPENIRFRREVNGRKVRKELIARIEPRETKIINNCKGQAPASAHGLRAITETMLHGSQFYMLFKEAFHIYGSFFETNKDEEAFRDILLHPETGLNVVIVTHPVTLERMLSHLFFFPLGYFPLPCFFI